MKRCCSCSCSQGSALATMTQQNKALTDALVAQSAMIGRLLQKSVDAALIPAETQITRVMGEQDTERARATGEELPPRPMASRPSAEPDDQPQWTTLPIPGVGGGMGA